jgi:hypothetical protein
MWRYPVNRLVLWVIAALAGGIAILSVSLGLITFLVTLLLLVLLALRSRSSNVAMSGLLTGFGAVWSCLIAGQLTSEGATDNAGFWLAVGVVPLIVGCAMAVPVVARTLHSRPIARG